MEQLDMQSYFDAVSAASRRSRATLLIITIVSVVMLSAMVNSGPWSSRQRQFEVAKDVLLWFSHLEEGTEPADIAGVRERFRLAQAFYERNAVLLDSKEAARATLDPLLVEGVDGRQVIKVPVLNLSLDARDLSQFSGVTYIVLLLMFRFSLYREKENLTITFLEARARGCLSQCYQLLRMRQVLFIPRSAWSKRIGPPRGASQEKEGRVWKLLPLGLFLLPPALQLLLAVNSVTILVQSAETTRQQAIEAVIHSVLFPLVVLFTYFCFRESGQMDVLWEEQEDLIKELDQSFEATLEGDWSYVANDQRGSFEGVSQLSIDGSDQLVISGVRTKHVKPSGEVDESVVEWSSSWIQVREGRLVFQFYVNQLAQKSARVWCHLEKKGACLIGEYVDLSTGKVQGRVEFCRADLPAAHEHA